MNPPALRMPHLRAACFAALLLMLCAWQQGAQAARHALIIGNNAYPGSELRSAVNDARDMAAALKQAGFEILLRENASRDAMFQAIQEFGSRLKDGDTAVFYFAGHAVQVRDRNYLIPIDAKVRQEDDVAFYSLDVAEILLRMDRARTRTNILILDACRDNPFSTTVRFTSLGLAQMSAPPGTLIAYATAPGQVAREGSGRNGVYTRQLLRHLPRPNQPIELMLRRVREGVLADTNGQQVPWDSSSLRGHFAFVVDTQAVESTASAGVASSDVRMNTERTFWESIKDSRDPKEFDAYIQQFPDGVFVMLARSRLEQLQQAGSRVSTAAAPVAGAVSGPGAPGGPSPQTAPADPQPPAAAPAPAVANTTPPTPSAASAPLSTTSSTPSSMPSSTPPSAPLPMTSTIGRSVAGPAGNAAGGPAGSPAGGPASVPGTIAPLAMATPSPAASPKIHVLADGSTFQGELQNGRIHGKGKLVSATAGEYTGEFVDGIRQGQGEQRWPNGDVYTGTFKADRADGQGVMQFASGDRYEGGFQNGLPSGIGKLRAKSGFEYEGDFLAGRRQGKGKAKFPDGNRYTGDFVGDLPDGQGVMEYPDGGRYEGGFSAGLPAGKGQYRFADGARYEGNFQAGLMSGLGVFHYKNGDRLEGQFDKGAASGAAVHFFAAGGRFEGNFSDQGRKANGFTIDRAGQRKPARLENGEFKPIDG